MEEEDKGQVEGKPGPNQPPHPPSHAQHQHPAVRHRRGGRYDLRRWLRRALERVGFFHQFGFACVTAVTLELACAAAAASSPHAHARVRATTTPPFKLLVAYVASNHLLFGGVPGAECPTPDPKPLKP